MENKDMSTATEQAAELQKVLSAILGNRRPVMIETGKIAQMVELDLTSESVPNPFYDGKEERQGYLSGFEILKKALGRGWQLANNGHVHECSGEHSMLAVVVRMK